MREWGGNKGDGFFCLATILLLVIVRGLFICHLDFSLGRSLGIITQSEVFRYVLTWRGGMMLAPGTEQQNLGQNDASFSSSPERLLDLSARHI